MLHRVSQFASRKVVAVAVTGSLVVTAGLALAPSAAADTSAPASETNALGVRLDPVLQISGTHARADENTGSSSADVVRVLGSSPLPNTGGSQAGTGGRNGALVDSGTTPAGRVKVAPWSTASASTAAHRRAEATAALASVVLFNNSTLFVDLLRSQSTADHDTGTSRSTSSGSSDGAVVGAGSVVNAQVLHSEASSDGGAATWLLGVNGMTIGTSEQLNHICSITAAPLVATTCLDVVGGIGEDNGASLLDGSVLDVVRPGALLLSTTTGSGNATPSVFGAHDGAAGRVLAAAPGAVRSGDRGRLPRTGAPTLVLVAVGLLLVAVGLLTVCTARARTAAAA